MRCRAFIQWRGWKSFKRRSLCRFLCLNQVVTVTHCSVHRYFFRVTDYAHRKNVAVNCTGMIWSLQDEERNENQIKLSGTGGLRTADVLRAGTIVPLQPIGYIGLAWPMEEMCSSVFLSRGQWRSFPYTCATWSSFRNNCSNVAQKVKKGYTCKEAYLKTKERNDQIIGALHKK